MLFDCHIHTAGGSPAQGTQLLAALNDAGLDGGVLLSEGPFNPSGQTAASPHKRVDDVMALANAHQTLFPFFFLDPTAEDAAEQIDYACKAGVRGFKAICSHFFPGDPRAMQTYALIAQKGKPLLFHSGILYDGKNPSGQYNRPCAFEPLLSVPRLRFALAHVSWPWTDECIAVYGKFASYLSNSHDPDAAELFLDLTCGTPRIYRRDLLTKLLAVGYEGLEDHLLWGTDNFMPYNAERSLELRLMDQEIYRDLHADLESRVYHDNLMRFLGKR